MGRGQPSETCCGNISGRLFGVLGILEERAPEEIGNTFSLGTGAMRDNLVAFVNAARRQSVVETVTSLAICNPSNLFLGLLSTILRIVGRN